MDKIKIDKATAVKLILDKKKEGIDEKTILKFFEENYSFSEGTYYNWKKEAIEKYKEFLSKIEPQEVRAESQKATSKILSKLERQIILSKIAKGKYPMVKHIVCDKVIQEVDISPTWSDRVKAISELNKMDGSYIKESPDKEDEFEGFDIQDA